MRAMEQDMDVCIHGLCSDRRVCIPTAINLFIIRISVPLRDRIIESVPLDH